MAEHSIHPDSIGPGQIRPDPDGHDTCPTALKVPPPGDRELLLDHARQRVAGQQLVPPLSLDELRRHAAVLVDELDLPSRFSDFATVLMGNAAWEETLATIPYERRVLLLPQCLRDRDRCPAEIDELGLLCEQCGACPTGALQEEAEELGYVVLVAEGTTVVTKLLESGKVDAVVGVSCLSALERSFPYATAAAIPGIAIPLVVDGCNRTGVDLQWVRRAIHLRSQEPWPDQLNLDRLKSEVRSWFTPDVLSNLLVRNGTHTEQLACDWIATGGKRWRPFLAACVSRTLAPPTGTLAPQRWGEGENAHYPKLAVAVECFHKASLAHDDIEDGDAFRYGQATLHSRHGMPIALNIGDLLVGEGYRLIAECGAQPQQLARMLTAAANGHRELCLGQGEELAWTHRPQPISVDRTLEIFRRKTAPAFEVALVLGAIAAGANGQVCQVLSRFSDALGIAYQIRDDIEDFSESDSDNENDIEAMRPSLLLALALQEADADATEQLTAALESGYWPDNGALIRQVVRHNRLEERAWQLYAEFKCAAIAALAPLRSQPLKSLMFRIVHKVLGDPPGVAGPKADRDEVLSTAPAAAEVVAAGEGETESEGSRSEHGW